ncbi:PHP domain-containing protein [Candidatus Woesearchaeota archaeon]|nr:PHP domain-containing protein [Candidatus Woesearchaeota archaeon]
MKITSDPAILKDKEINWVDMHHHSTVSDGNKSPHFLYKWAKKNRKGLCLTDHNYISGSIYLSKQKDIFTIPSIEVTSKEAKDVLVYFYSSKDLIHFWENEIKREIKKKNPWDMKRTEIPFNSLLEKAKDYNGINILPHPLTVPPKRTKHFLKDKEKMKDIHGVESHNFTLGLFKETTQELKDLNLPQTAGSDSHSITKFGTLTGSYAFDREDFINDLLKKNNIIIHPLGGKIRRAIDQVTIFTNNLFPKQSP